MKVLLILLLLLISKNAFANCEPHVVDSYEEVHCDSSGSVLFHVVFHGGQFGMDIGNNTMSTDEVVIVKFDDKPEELVKVRILDNTMLFVDEYEEATIGISSFRVAKTLRITFTDTEGYNVIRTFDLTNFNSSLNELIK